MGCRHIAVAVLTGALALTSGCARYQPKPLTAESVSDALAAPDQTSISLSAETFQHPIVKPMSIDLARGLSPEQAAVLAVILNPSLRAERDRRAQSASQLLQAGILPNPTLTAGLELPHDNPPSDSFTGYNLGLDWDVSALITHDAKVRAARAANASVDLDVAWKEWQVAQAAKTAAYDVVALRAALAAAKASDERQAKNLSLIHNAVERHQKTILDQSTAEAVAQDAHAVVLAGEHDLKHQITGLNRAVGLQPGTPIALRNDIQLPSHLDPPAMEQLLDGLENRRLDLLALERGYESQDQTLRAAILAQFPKLNFGLSAARDTSDVHTVGLGVSLDIPLFDRNQGTIANETATRQKLFDEYTDRVFEARWDILTAVQDIKAVNAQIADAESTLPGLEKSAQTFRDALANGNTDVINYAIAQTALINKQLAIVKLRQQLIEYWIALEIASGEYLPIPQQQAATGEADK